MEKIIRRGNLQFASDNTKQSKYEIKFNSSRFFLLETARQNDERSGKFHIPLLANVRRRVLKRRKNGGKRKQLSFFTIFTLPDFLLFIFF